MKSLWSVNVADPHFAPLTKDVRVDVAIVGGGITGVTAAVLLEKAGRTIALLESGDVANGETLRTTAHVTSVTDLRYRQMGPRFGRRGMEIVADSGMAAIEQIQALATELRISCDWLRLPAYLYSEDASEVPGLEEEAEAARQAGLDATFTREVPTPFPVAGAVRFGNQARFHPTRYLLALASSLAGRGSHVFEHSRVVDIQDQTPCVVRTDRGTVTADAVIVATDSPVCNRVFLHTKLAPYRTYALAAWVERELPGLLWDTADPYHYIRSHPFSGRHLLIVGGKDHRVGEVDEGQEPMPQLERYARDRFGVRDIVYRWSGQILEPVDGLPYIGKNSFSKSLYVATGFAGTGMTGGTMAAMILRDLIEGRPNPWASLYAATRVKPLASFKRYLEENVDFPRHLAQDWLTGTQVRSPDELPAGEGGITRIHGRRAAVYRDEEGMLHAVSPICTHLGCLVHFNTAEKSWDCPCHGSRFGTDGTILHGPATTPLEVIAQEQTHSPKEEEEDPTWSENQPSAQ